MRRCIRHGVATAATPGMFSILLTILASPGPDAPGTEEVALSWSAPPGCPQEGAVRGSWRIEGRAAHLVPQALLRGPEPQAGGVFSVPLALSLVGVRSWRRGAWDWSAGAEAVGGVSTARGVGLTMPASASSPWAG